MQPKKLYAAVAAALATCPLAHAAVEEMPSTLKDQQSVAITIYNENLALVKDTRRVTLEAGPNRLALREVSGRMRPETAQLRSLSQPGALTLIEQNFDFDLLTPAKLLEKFVGRTVRVVKTHPTTGAESVETATVLAASIGVVLRIGDRIETGLPGRIVYDGVPANLCDRPTLVTELHSARAGGQTLELSYLSGGLSWNADYGAELNGADSALDLNGWVTLTNTSGTTYRNAKLQLVAGDVNRVRREMAAGAATAMPMSAAAPAPMAEQALFEYHLYTLGRPTTIAENQTKQVELLTGHAIPVTKEYRFANLAPGYNYQMGEAPRVNASVRLKFTNTEKSGLGIPLPQGTVRVYKADNAGQAIFVGEDAIQHTPKNEYVDLTLGQAFDVTARGKQTDFETLGDNVYESAYEIEFKNAKSEAVTVILAQTVPGDWKMLEESTNHEKADASTALWHISVPANGSTKLTYRVRVKY